MNLRRLDDIHPLPVGFKDILPKKLQAIPVNLNGTVLQESLPLS